MSLNKEDVWADLWYVLDELERPRRDMEIRLIDYVDNLDEQTRIDLCNKLVITSVSSSLVYSKAIARAQARNSHEAIEKGLKAILIDGGWKNETIHDLHKLLEYVQQHNPKKFSDVERCFDSTIRYLKFATGSQRSNDVNILDYFRENGNQQTFIDNRYASIEGRNSSEGMIVLIYMEIMRALLWLLFDWTPVDIESRIEEAARKAVLAERERDAEWNAEEWLGQGLVRPRLEVIGNLDDSKVLRAAVRRCAKESNDSDVEFWANRIRRNDVLARSRVPRSNGSTLGE